MLSHILPPGFRKSESVYPMISPQYSLQFCVHGMNPDLPINMLNVHREGNLVSTESYHY
jgi:hypothetical protein